MDNKTLVDKAKGYNFMGKFGLDEKNVSPDPFEQFEAWFKDAVESDSSSANVMYIATSDRQGTPALRTVLLKGFDKDGFVFFTNYMSRKGKELDENPKASLLFFWKEEGRQVRIEGEVRKISGRESDEYFQSRPFESRVAALASNQSSVIENREALDNEYFRILEEYKSTGEVPRPDNWGGYKVIPVKIEFWQGQENRMHDRILYTKEDGGWKIERLSP